MIILLLIYSGFLSLLTISLIYRYEDKIKDLKHNLNAMTRRFHIAKQAVVDSVLVLDEENEALQKQVEALKAELRESDGAYWAKMYHDTIREIADKKIQYEYSTHKDDVWSKDIYGDTPYVNPWNNTKGDK
jgi:hypothetical protein